MISVTVPARVLLGRRTIVASVVVLIMLCGAGQCQAQGSAWSRLQVACTGLAQRGSEVARRLASKASSSTPSVLKSPRRPQAGGQRQDADTLVRRAKRLEAEMRRSIARTGGAGGIAQEAAAAWYDASKALERSGRTKQARYASLRAQECLNLSTRNFIPARERPGIAGVS